MDSMYFVSRFLMDDTDTIIRKFKRAVTDSAAQITYSDEQPGVKNLLDIYCACNGITSEEATKAYEGVKVSIVIQK